YTYLYPNGNISFYYEKIPNEIVPSEITSEIWNDWICRDIGLSGDVSGTHSIRNKIEVPKSLIKSRTLVQFQPMPKVCFKQQSNESCFDATTSKFKCYWCPTISKCSTGQDIHIQKWLENDCYKTNISQPQLQTTTTFNLIDDTTSRNADDNK
ncbi:unnamed protein product, partial [Schistosoma turkestanicum]